MDWPEFQRRFARELGSSGVLLQGAQARQWNPETVEIVLSQGMGAAGPSLLSATLPPLLEKAWNGRRPALILSGGLNKLANLKDAPDLQELQAVLPGEFIEYRPGAPTEAAAPAEMAAGEETSEDLAEEPNYTEEAVLDED